MRPSLVAPQIVQALKPIVPLTFHHHSPSEPWFHPIPNQAATIVAQN
jgi:hypothetical protein